MSMTAPLACPHCATALTGTTGQLACENGHHFDVAKGGHVHLARGVLPQGDTKEMLAAREQVVTSGMFAPLYQRVATLVAPTLRKADTPVVADIGAGTGALLAQLVALHAGTIGVAIDTSPYAARRAQRAHTNIQAVVADAWQPLPLLDGSVTVVTSVFAPRNPASFATVLHKDGIVVVLSAGQTHLVELRERFGLMDIEENKAERIQSQFDAAFTCAHVETFPWHVACDDTLAYAMMAMGPNAHHHQITPDAVTFAGDVTCEVMIHLFTPRN